MNKYLLLLILSVFIASCGVNKVWYERSERAWETYHTEDSTEIVSTVFLIGDAGKPDANRQEPVLKALERDLVSCKSPNKAIMFLGDNVYHYGLLEEGTAGRQESERRLDEQLKILKDFEGRVIFIPGNHDWNFSQMRGWESVVREENYLERYLGRDDIMLPGGGCPGPVEAPLGDDVVMIIIDSEWWLHSYDKPAGPRNVCDVEDDLDFISQLNDAFERNDKKNIILALHHPILTNSNHGGYYSLKDHVFPITMLRENWYIPLPVIGSLYPIARKYGISKQDLPNPRYSQLAETIKSIIRERNNVLVVSGHDHNLQLHSYKEAYQIVSGSGSKMNYVTRGRTANFVARQKGYARIDYYSNGEVWVQFNAPKGDGSQTDTIYKKPLYSYQIGDVPDPKKAPPDYTDSTISIAAGPEYATSFFLHRWLLGEHYRKEWATPVGYRYLDMEREKGGLTPIKRGGGQQTTSLRLMGGDKNQYTIRSINKNPELVLPPGLRPTFVGDVFKDQISAAHPYGALTLPPMAEAIGIYHTNPVYRYVPFTPSLGIYLDEYAGKPVLLEIRPDENLSEFQRFGNSKNVVGTDKLYEQLQEDNDNSVDSRELAKNRLFDMLIGDWDRHQDQWRWAEFEKEGKGELYVPVPRDRDQVYGAYKGLLSRIAASPIGKRNLSTLSYKVTDVKGINISGTYLERELANDLTRADWVAIAEEIRDNLPDSLIESAVRRMPPEIFALHGEEIVAKLKSRRDDLPRVANRYYEILAKDVKIITSDKHEYVKIERGIGSTEVTIFKTDKEGEKKKRLYNRTFYNNETNNLTIHALGGNDSILVSGESKRGIKIRVAGGLGDDFFQDSSRVRGWKKRTTYYDDFDTTNVISKGKESKAKLDHKWYAHQTHLRSYDYNFLKPIARLKFDQDNGVTLGVGGRGKTFGFRKSPYSSSQKFYVAYTTRIKAFSAKYEGEYPMLFSRSNGLEVAAQYSGDDNKINYFGQGNETPNTLSIQNYRLNYFEHHVSPSLVHSLSKKTKLKVGPRFEYTEFFTGINQGIALDNNATAVSRVTRLYGATVDLDLNYLDSEHNPSRGVLWKNGIDYRTSSEPKEAEYAKLRSDFTIYYTPNWNYRMTLAFRTGAQHMVGNYPFFKSSFLGGNEQLRGYRMTRFAGRSSVYQNLEARLRIHTMQSVIATGEYGLFGFVDNGRVWADNKASGVWHQGYGGGAWLNLFQLFVVSGGVGVSKEGTFYRVDYGFFF